MDRSILRRDEFKYLHFTEAQQSGLVHLARRIHAQSYVASQFVTVDSLVDGALPAELDHARGQHVTYSIAYVADSQIEEESLGSSDPTGHAMATWRIRDIAPDDDFTSLPAYTSTAGALSSDGLDFLRSVDGDPKSILREIGALAKHRCARPVGYSKSFGTRSIVRLSVTSTRSGYLASSNRRMRHS
ncbi:hypothetical protein MSHO_33610 [Mycobacterium shottsii]|uniref:Uncharacterized protein n=1 Tax=Mycobacterium shottsii TaxID=133549 RepID=A0A7I7LDB2_9MYCO|nr:hypothetical protein [Mycobacterium shottsii]BBX58016.1 hypothetical protein MSHO_33610 [Mycobacterium shottsii]